MGRELKRVLLEASVVTIVGLAFALAANLVSPRGLSLRRNYFPQTGLAAAGIATVSNVTILARGTNPAGRETVVARLKDKGLRPIDSKEALQLFHDPQHEQELIVFVDARDDRHYQEGHIPGAYQFDRYYPEKHLPAVLPACLNATTIVVYCAGGNCEDSRFAAVALRDAGVAQERLFVYAGGMTEWAANGLPVEVGGRKSSKMRAANP